MGGIIMYKPYAWASESKSVLWVLQCGKCEKKSIRSTIVLSQITPDRRN